MDVIYKVTVTVPDEPQVLSEDYSHFSEEEDGSVDSAGMARIVMAERLGCDEDYGFEYRVDYDLLETPPG